MSKQKLQPEHYLLENWRINISARQIERSGETITLEPLVMAVLHYFCQHPQEVVSTDTLLGACWPDQITGDNPVHKTIAMLRKALGDSTKVPRFIETVRLRGYRLIGRLHLLSEQGPRAHRDTWRDASPFLGLSPFGPAHASIFFGRDAAIAELHARLLRQWTRGYPLVVVLGASGSGKTSLVQAGLIPRLLQSATSGCALSIAAFAVIDLGETEQGDVFEILAGGMLDWEHEGTPLLQGYSIATLACALRSDTATVLREIRLALVPVKRHNDDVPVLLVLDRMEALCNGMPPARLGEWMEVLGTIIRSRLVLVIALCRNDFYSGLTELPVFMVDKAASAHMDLLSPDAEALSQIVRLPAQAAGLVYGRDPGGLQRLDDRIYSDALQARDALPLLQYTLQALYEAREPGGLLSWGAYDALGGLEGAISFRAESVLAQLPGEQQAALPRLLPKLISLGQDDVAPTGRWCKYTDLGDDAEARLVDALVHARLLVSAQYHGIRSVRVAHEAMLRQWQRITSWLHHHRASLAVRDELSAWIERWDEAGHAAAFLLPSGEKLWQAAAALHQYPTLFSAEAGDYVHRSLARMKRQAWTRRVIVAGLAGLALLATIAAMRYAQMARMAEHREAQSQKLSSFMLGDLADRLRPIGRLDLLGRVGDEGVALLRGPAFEGETAEDTLQRAKALVVVAEVNSTRGKDHTPTALRALDEASRLLPPLEGRLPSHPGDYYKTVGATAFWQGQIAFDQGDLPAARRAMSAYRDACLRWQRVAPADQEATKELGFALNSLGSIAVRSMHWPEAQSYFALAMAAKRSVLASRPDDPELAHALVNAQSWLGQSEHALGNDGEALALYEAALVTENQLFSAHPGDKVRLHELAVLNVRRAEALSGLARRHEAVDALVSAQARLKSAVENDPDNLRWRAESVHLDAGLLLARLEADPEMHAQQALAALTASIEREAAALKKQKRLGLETRIRVAAIGANMALQQGSFDAAARDISLARKGLDALAASSAPSWQDMDMHARLVLLQLRHLDALPLAARSQGCGEVNDALRSLTRMNDANIVTLARRQAMKCNKTSIAPLISGRSSP
ncbi:winged helix-turn-helix domain-containing protein [Massilia sp. DJPM01]|uniref:nSTAND1 domain-containing NTPase n=1 Tax=Massilia sp. DJPM01 TaxID=3024404 RepID=UPI00259E59DA|nr:winged helix-turn-helix domain-containing protein [Massilia sp. DJPM01]